MPDTTSKPHCGCELIWDKETVSITRRGCQWELFGERHKLPEFPTLLYRLAKECWERLPERQGKIATDMDASATIAVIEETLQEAIVAMKYGYTK